jgi:hypothetical protein
MKTRDLDGDIVDWKPSGEIVTAEDTRNRSQLHLAARQILYELFPTTQIIEEVSIPIKRGVTQYFDFFISNIKLAVEVNGQQHYKFNSLFHSTASDFMAQKKRDQDKRDWCEQNRITLIELPYNEKIEEWLTRIQSR